MKNLNLQCSSLLAARSSFFSPTPVKDCQLLHSGCKCSIQETGFACLILTCEHFSDLSRTGRLSTSLILQFAGWNSRPCLSLPPPSNENPRSTSYWPTTWLIKTCLESRCQLTVKPIKPNSAPHTKQSLQPWRWILCLVKGLITIFFFLPFRMLRINNGKCHIQYFNL